MGKYAIANAAAHFAELRDMLDEIGRLDGASRESERRREEIEDTARERPLDIEVRGSWHSPGQSTTATKFQIMLTIGGPELRIHGRLNEHGEPERDTLRLEWQDWGTQWTAWTGYFTDGGDASAEREAYIDVLEWFADLFYYGE